MYNSFDFFFFLSLLFAVGGTVQQPGISAKRALIFLTGKMRCVCDGQLGYFPVVQLHPFGAVKELRYTFQMVAKIWGGIFARQHRLPCHRTAHDVEDTVQKGTSQAFQRVPICIDAPYGNPVKKC